MPSAQLTESRSLLLCVDVGAKNYFQSHMCVFETEENAYKQGRRIGLVYDCQENECLWRMPVKYYAFETSPRDYFGAYKIFLSLRIFTR